MYRELLFRWSLIKHMEQENKLISDQKLKTKSTLKTVLFITGLVIISILTTLTKCTNITYLPDELLVDEPLNPSQTLETFLNNCSNKKVVFPRNKTFVLERQLVIHHVENLEIDFNGCTIKLPDNLSWNKTRYDTGAYVPLAAITVHDSKNITFKNYTIDGNSPNIDPEQWCIGLWLSNINGFSSVNGSFKYCNYHHIVIYPGTKDINFVGTYFKDHGGASNPAGISDVYVANSPEDNFSFIDTTVDNTALRERQAQCFYISGYNGLIDTVHANNCSIPLDVRKGTHIAKNFTINNAELMLMIQPNPINSTEFANLTASNFTGINIQGKSNGGAAGVYIVGCEKVHLNNFVINMDPAAEYSWYGIRIRKFYDAYPVKDVVISDIEISNPRVSSLMFQYLVDSVSVNNIKSVNAPYAIREDYCTINQYVENLSLVNSKELHPISNMIVIN